MKTTINNLKLKKGDTINVLHSWNGYDNDVIQFYLINWDVASSGKKQTHLTKDTNHAGERFYNDYEKMLIEDKDFSLVIEEAKQDCLNAVADHVEEYQLRYDTRKNDKDKSMREWADRMLEISKSASVKPIEILVMDANHKNIHTIKVRG
jgi:hypothetical protein